MNDSDPLLRIDLASPVPAYRQIAAGLRTLLVRGELPAGSRLPTIRELAMDLGVHANTVAQAYKVLAGEGWLELRRRRGATVLDRPRPRAGEADLEVWRRRLDELIAEGLAAGLDPASLSEALHRAAREHGEGGTSDD
ncbi:MAG TPA: GntR family transcriptional regulator [Acidobacteria bacterium]|nr:GntR family transcriptional regulator [Acidobacteriota bacterium]